jgi:zinc protease
MLGACISGPVRPDPVTARRTSVHSRRHRIVPDTALLLASLAAAPALHAQSAMLGAVLSDTVLDNGLHVIVVPNPTTPLVTLQVTVRNGAFTQLTDAEQGIPHMLEHMLFRSYGRSGFGAEAGRLDAYYNGTTSDETVTYYMTLPSSNLERGVRLLAELMRRPRFRAEDLRAEQLVVRGELERSVSNPEYMLAVAINRRLWGAEYRRKNALGNVITIQEATPQLLQQAYDRFYVPNNAALVMTGDVTAADAFVHAARHFAAWQRGPDPFADLELPPMPRLARPDRVTVEADANDVTIMVRWQGPSVRDDAAATYAADVFASVVNDAISAFQERLVDSGLFQSVSLGYRTLAHTGPITLRALTTAEQLADASAALRAELDRFAEPGYITDEALEIAKTRRAVRWAMAMETPSGLASFVGDMWSVAGLDYLRGYLDAMQQQTVADLERFVAQYLTGQPRVTAFMLSPATRAELGARLTNAYNPWRN